VSRPPPVPSLGGGLEEKGLERIVFGPDGFDVLVRFVQRVPGLDRNVVAIKGG
jgi:hypothetical protein